MAGLQDAYRYTNYSGEFFQYGDRKSQVYFRIVVSAHRRDRCEIPEAIPTFATSFVPTDLCPTLSHAFRLRKFKMATCKTGSTCISTPRRDRNEIPKALPTFSTSPMLHDSCPTLSYSPLPGRIETKFHRHFLYFR